MSGSHRLSQAISEGESVSVLADVAGDAAARAAAAQGADGLVLRGAVRLAGDVSLPRLVVAPPDAAAAAGADAVVVSARASDVHVGDQLASAAAQGLEGVVEVRDEEELAHVLEEADPEILLLAPSRADGEDERLERLLGLLSDVPAGKLAIADVTGSAAWMAEELERAGVDAVVVESAHLGAFVSADPPEV